MSVCLSVCLSIYLSIYLSIPKNGCAAKVLRFAISKACSAGMKRFWTVWENGDWTGIKHFRKPEESTNGGCSDNPASQTTALYRYLSIYYLCIYLSIYPPIYSPIYLYLSIRLSVVYSRLNLSRLYCTLFRAELQ